MNAPPAPALSASPTPAEKLRAGSLIYTKAGLFTLFTWLLWGDFSFTLMETVWPSVLPLMLNSLQAPNTVISLLIVTVPQILNFFLNPIISTASDRHRGRFGRRTPFLLFATPFVALFLVLLGFSREIGRTLALWLGSAHSGWLGPNAVTIGVIAVLVVGFRFFEMFVGTVYWYLFNDVVPGPYLGRFLSLFRVVGSLAGAFYSFFVYGYAASHASEIFIGAGMLYGVVFLLMCLNVREGTYPPPEPMTEGRNTPLAYIRTFLKECFSHRVFILLYLTNASWSVANSINTFHIFLYTSLGLTLEQVGAVVGGAGLVGVVLLYPAGVLVDRIHPIRVMLIAKLGLCFVTPLSFIYLLVDLPPSVVFWVYAALTVVALPLSTIFTAAGLPLMMRILPRERYGQFCAANAMLTAAAIVVGGTLAGGYLDLVKFAYEGAVLYYRWIPLWTTAFLGISLFFTWKLFREWQRLGGDRNYRPPKVH